MSEEEIDGVEQPEVWDDVFDDEARAVLRLADALCGDSSNIPEDLVGELRTLFGEQDLAELILVCGQANLNNRAGNAAKQLLG